ncbi:zinc knuckle CX2CX4HX4C containing protein [Tanacetum coccineum]|uniref:Zinc knuckle CX2CX4HX4C containing protein n=1 Tax=Tanacetum coccineum TaxID=301880 RepID=A0ABQ4XS21_9ASTR
MRSNTLHLVCNLVDNVLFEKVLVHLRLQKTLTHVQFKRTFLIGFLAQSIRSSSAIALDSPYLLIRVTETSQRRQHESRKSPTAELFDVDSGRISIHHLSSFAEFGIGISAPTSLPMESIWNGGRDPFKVKDTSVQADVTKEDHVSSQPLDEPIIQDASICVEPSLYAGVELSMPRRVVENVSTRFENTLYGYFIGKRLAFLMVEYFVKNNWAKYGLKRIMLNAKGFFFFKFDSRVGLEKELNRVPIWVKFHDVLLEVFDEERISIIGSHIGKPIMLDAYTSSMCKDSWGRSSFSRCLIKVNSDEPLKDSFTIGIPMLEGLGFTKEVITVEYEWKPPRCDKCKIFGHYSDMSSCPNRVVVAPKMVDNNSAVDNTNDGFQQVVNKRHNNKRSSTGNKIPKGVPVAKGFQVGKEFNCKPKAPNVSSNGGGTRGEEM